MTAFLATLALIAPAPYGHHHHHHHRDHRLAVVAPYRAHLERIAYCESTDRWHLDTGNGFYGGLQFTLRSWYWVGGRGWPHLASKLEQMYRAVRLMYRQGWGAWPVCGWR
jgi:hypothetical protein